MAQNDEPSALEQIQGQLNQLTNGLNQFAQGVDQRFQHLAAAQQQGARPQEQQRPEPQISLDAANAELLNSLGTAPVRVFGEAIQTAKAEALREFQRLQEQERMTQAQRAAQKQFWDEFQYHNQDVVQFMPQIWSEFQRNGHLQDPSERANEAAKNVRALLAQQRADAVEQERRSRQARMPAGFPIPQPSYDTSGNQDNAPRHPAERLDDIRREHEEQRSKRMWDKIATPEYHAAAQQRAAQTRIIRQRVA